jgi:hypothetical protein
MHVDEDHSHRLSAFRTRLVHFRIADVYYPSPDEILRALHGDELLQGVVLDASEGAGAEEAFLVVKVEGLSQPVIVPMGHIRGVV